MQMTTLCYIEKDDKYLMLHRIKKKNDINEGKWIGVGGHAEGSESPEECLKREVQEELGKEIEITGYVSTVENFFEMKGAKYHEIMFIYKAEFVKEEDKKLESTLQNIEGKDYLQYEWIDLDKIDEYPLRPDVLKEVLKESKFPVHKINID